MVKRILGFSLFFAVFLTVYGAINYYAYWSLVRAIPVSGSVLLLVQGSVVILALAYPLCQLLKPKLRLPFLSFLGALWMGILSFSILVFLVRDLIAWLLPFQIQILAVVTITGMTLWAARKAWRGPKLKSVSIQHKKLTRPLSIVHLSDLHLGGMTSRKWLERVVTQVNSLDADIIVITGDLVDDSLAAVEKFIPAIHSLRAKYGIYAVSGNHEYYQGIEHFQAFCKAAGIKVADGEFLPVTDGINLAGLGGRATRAGQKLEDNIRTLLAPANSDDYNIFLIHHPVGFEQTAKLGVDLQLSGHTHKGQILPFNFLVGLIYRYAYGLHTVGSSHIYTSSGTGTWGPPLRLGSNSEIVMIEVN